MMNRIDTALQPANLLIRASAGTGKTFQLSNRFLGLVAAGQPVDSILASTFTRKGAGEILDRVLVRLAEAATSAQKAAELARHLGVAALDDQRCLALLGGLLRHLHRLRVGTLDSFFIEIARSFSLELGQSPGWQILDEIDDQRLRAEAIRQVLQEHSTADVVRLMHLLTKGEASRSISQQLADLVQNLYEIYLEAPADAWSSIQRRRLLMDAELEAALQALESAPLPDDKRFAKTRDQDLDSARTGDWDAVLAKGIGSKIAAGETSFYKKPIAPELMDAYQPLVDHARAYLLDEIINQNEATYRLLARFDEAYRPLKLRQHAMRFQDVTQLLGGAVMDGRMAEIEYRIDGSIHHLLLDEFQDTNPAQWRVLRTLARRLLKSPQHGSLFCVGDVKQAIYGWRGGVAEIFDTLQQELPELALQPLNQSYRSSPTVIETVNRVFANLAANPALANHPQAARRWAVRFETHSTVRGDMPGQCRLVSAPAAADGQQQAHVTQAFAAQEIARLVRACPGASIGVLVRRNKAVARLIYELRKLDVDASEEGGNPLSHSPAVQLLLSLVTLADHPGDGAARFHVANSPLAPHVGLADHTDDDAASRLSLEIRRRLVDDGYGKTISGWVERLASSCDARGLSRLMQLVKLAYGYDAVATGRADHFVQYVTRKKVEAPTSADVRVMTFHQAKGLQFDIVVLSELDYQLAGQPPEIVVGRPGPMAEVTHVCRYVSQEHRVVLPQKIVDAFDANRRLSVEESLCVLYVALTRAVHALHMVIAPSRPNEKSLPATAAGLLRAALAGPAPVSPQSTLFELGTADWHQHRASKPASARPAPRTEPLVVRLKIHAGRRSRGLESVSPSQLEGGSRVVLQNRLRLDTAAATTRGTLMHAWMESIGWLDDGLPSNADFLRATRGLATAELDLDALLAEFRAMLERPAIAALLSRSAYAGAEANLRRELEREWLFAVRDGDAILSGQVDRLVVLYDGTRAVAADVIDFKTDRISSNAELLASRTAHYRPQLEAYRRACSKLLRLPPEKISARLAFLEPGAVQEL